jgi:superfamily II DNA helicase RecQ
MKVKVFQLRLTNDNLQSDQDILNNFLNSVTVKKTATELIQGQSNCWSILVFYEDHKSEMQVLASDKIMVQDTTDLSGDEKAIFETLKQWRQDKAAELSVANYMICHNSELMSVAKVKPQTLPDLIKIKGFGEQKISRYGDDILAVLNSVS